MRDYFQPTVKRYLRRWRPTQRPATIHSKTSILRRFVAYLREHHPEVHRFSQLQRDPHIEFDQPPVILSVGDWLVGRRHQ